MTDEDVQTFLLDPDVLRMEWFWVARYFDEEADAKAAFDEVRMELPGSRLGGYRLLDALPSAGGRPRIVVIVGTLEEKVREAARKMGGLSYAIELGSVKGLIMRRLRFMLAGQAFGLEPGVIQFEHQPGMRLNESGEVVPMDDDDA